MTRPRLDPTLTLQPDGTAGLDVTIRSDQATTNQNGNAFLDIGEPNNVSGSIRRALIKFDLSTLPSDALLITNTLSLYATTDLASGSRTVGVYRVKRAWVETEATWNIYSTGNSWSTAGGFHADDCEQTAIGSTVLVEVAR